MHSATQVARGWGGPFVQYVLGEDCVEVWYVGANIVVNAKDARKQAKWNIGSYLREQESMPNGPESM